MVGVRIIRPSYTHPEYSWKGALERALRPPGSLEERLYEAEMEQLAQTANSSWTEELIRLGSTLR